MNVYESDSLAFKLLSLFAQVSNNGILDHIN